jgi:hypothetical protein
MGKTQLVVVVVVVVDPTSALRKCREKGSLLFP